MNHTPGPWDFEHDKKEDMISIAEKGFDRSDDSDDKSVCGIWGLGGQSKRSDEEQFCNARLIAAAPDLLEALEASITEMQELVTEIKALRPGSYRADTTITRAKEAISKAKGL